jgi:hypothetical protein
MTVHYESSLLHGVVISFVLHVRMLAEAQRRQTNKKKN